jgi:fibro-slime domain-containing protein
MLKRTLHLSRAALFGVATAILGAGGVAGCEDAGTQPAQAAIRNVLITADSVAPGQDVIVDLGAKDVRYVFDFRTPIDFERITLLSPAKAEGPMSEAILHMQEEGHDPLESVDQRFSIVGDPSYFTELKPGEIAELRETGMLMKEGSAPVLEPQVVDGCVEVVVYVQVTVVINGQPFTFWCQHVIIVCEEPPCEPAGPEVCNGEDDDCDGTVDEDANVACSSPCGNGEQVCIDGQLTECDAPEAIPVGDQIDLTGILRDFTDAHPDFEDYLGVDPGIVLPDLGPGNKPVYAGQAGNPSTHGQGPFDQWFRDVAGVNARQEYTITLTKQPNSNVYTYNNNSFFPLDNQLFGNQGRAHNYHLTFEVNMPFLYSGGEVFTFTGDDDLWVYVNNKLAIDLGGVHPPLNQTINMDAKAAELGITPGNVYHMHLFFAERHTVLSHFRIDTTISQFYTCN